MPDGLDAMGQNVGGVNVGGENDTASLAIESSRRWWEQMGQPWDPIARNLRICADRGGSHGSRVRWWKRALPQLAKASGVEVTVCPCPPGTSQWKTSDQRVFGHIRMKWRGQPLMRHEVIVDCMGATPTKSGFTVTARLDTHASPVKINVSAEDMARLNLTPHACHGAWNDTVKQGPYALGRGRGHCSSCFLTGP